MLRKIADLNLDSDQKDCRPGSCNISKAMKALQYVLLIVCSFVLFACGKSFKVNSEPTAQNHRHEQEPVFKENQPDMEDSGAFYRVKSKA